jgi:predicted O-linked N-acetylglucosamine transferase (SPINDLY family)
MQIDALPAQSDGSVTFGCLNNFCKVNDRVLELWVQVLKTVPNSRLLLMAPEGGHVRIW